MARSKRLAIVVVAALGPLVPGVPAMAQFGSIFGDPPRPPAGVPGGQLIRPARQPPPAPPSDPDYAGSPPAGTIQSQPLPPPPGADASPPPPAAAPVVQGALPSRPDGTPPSPLPGLPPGQRQPRGTPQPGAPAATPSQPATPSAAPQPNEEVITELPSEKISNPTAVFSGLDKITGRTITFDVAINETVQFGALQVTPRVCYTRPPTETSNTDGFIEVDEITLQGEVKRIFTGWMFAASPGLHAVEHPIYDIWLVDCKKDATTAAAGSQPSPPSATPTSTPTLRR